ncbi:glycosyltransferase WbuB [Sphingobacterium puteale]|uniref:Glycosyltransferase WbuB n=1 Tax=Sphingobacterium puteale TaxID=2420510 RepID=A0A420VQV3_9SPHI|nr:glycosyltransferase family 4 protein [Sphingobacterium puteale]RKO68675.1 glycosyltransferase WbuB [Sphingobacterium puteale]
MKRILYLTFYFEPDLCAGSFRNSPLVKELAGQAGQDIHIEVITTLPNRYSSFEADALAYEQYENLSIHRVAIPKHQSGMKDQILSFREYYSKARKIAKGKKYDLVIASSSRLFTAYLGYTIAKKQHIPLYLDIRDIFYDTLEDVLKDGFLKKIALPIIKRIEKRTFGYAKHINLISGGFKSYFSRYRQAIYSFYPNGVDNIFIDANNSEIPINREEQPVKTIVYAGNLGEGQGLHKIIPEAAKALEGRFQFLIIGDGGAKEKLEEQLESLNVGNVELRAPVKRDELIAIYLKADFLFVHLNNYRAFEKVLPSKLFELATFPLPIIAGVGGFASEFVQDNIENTILFEPCNVEEFVKKMNIYQYKKINRVSFIERFKRDTVNREMAATMLKYI